MTNQNISIWYKHSFQKAILSCGKKNWHLKFLQLLNSRKPKIWLGTPLPKLRRKTTKLQGKSVYTILFVGGIFPPSKVHIDQGTTRGIGSSKCCPQQAAVDSQGSRRKQCGRSLETGSFRRYYSCLPGEGWKQHPTVVPSSRHICRFLWRVRQCVVREWHLTPTGIELDSGNRQGWWTRLIFMQGS